MKSIESFNMFCFDFDGVFTDNKVYVCGDGSEIVKCDRSDGLALEYLKKYAKAIGWNPKIMIVSKENNIVVKARATKLDIECHQGINDKLTYIEGIIKSSSDFEWQKLVYFGNDLNDYLPMQKAGLAVCPKDAHPEIKRISGYVSCRNGGDGFIREFVESNTPLAHAYTQTTRKP